MALWDASSQIALVAVFVPERHVCGASLRPRESRIEWNVAGSVDVDHAGTAARLPRRRVEILAVHIVHHERRAPVQPSRPGGSSNHSSSTSESNRRSVSSIISVGVVLATHMPVRTS